MADPCALQQENVFSEPPASDTATVREPSPGVSRGVCPIRAEFLRPAPNRVVLDATGRTRGMNKGADRQRPGYVVGTQKPTLAGEQNIFFGETLQRIKESVRQAHPTVCGHTGSQVVESEPTDSNAPMKASGNTTDFQAGTKRGRQEGGPSSPSHLAATSLASEVERTKDAGQPVRPAETEDDVRELLASRRDKARGLFVNKLVLAPLTTVGNLPFRRICKAHGADVTISEMAVTYNLNRLQKNEWSLLRRHECEDIFGIQLAVSRPQEAATIARALEASGFTYDFLDINCGCPVERVVKSGCGCGLWERKGRLREVVQTLAQRQSKPVSIKCRIGTDEREPLLHRTIGEYATWGAAAVTIHGRSRNQRYTKLSNWDYVGHCSQLTSLPVIGNGDILALEDVEEHRRCWPHISSFMIGRGALIKPWIFEEIKTGQVKDISSSERMDMLRQFCKFGFDHWGADERGVMTTRRFLCEWLSFLHRYVPAGLLERLPQHMNERPPHYEGRDDLETLMSSSSVTDWIRLSEMLLGPVEDKFRFTPKHKSNSYAPSDGAEVQG